MDTLKQIKKQKQAVARSEKQLAEAKLKKRRADTRRKIELGGLVIKAGMDGLKKTTIFGALTYTYQLIEKDSYYREIFESMGVNEFNNAE